MSRDDPRAPLRWVAWRVIAIVLLAGFSTRAPLAQQPAADAGGSTHAAAPSEGKAGNDNDIPIIPLLRRPTKQDINIPASQFLKMVPAKNRPILPAGPNVVDRNAIGVAVVRHDAAPAAPLVGRVAVRAPAPQPIGVSGLPVRSGQMAPVRVPPVQPPVSSRAMIGGASFTRPGMALLPVGGPAKPAATGIDGTSLRPKH